MRVSSAENPVPNVLFARHLTEPPLGLQRIVLNVHFMVLSEDIVTSLSCIFCGLKGSLIQDSVNLPTSETFLPEYLLSRSVIHQRLKRLTTSHISLGTSRVFHSTRCFNCLVVTTFTGTGSPLLVHLQSSGLGVSPLLPRIEPSATLPCPAIGHLRLPFRITAVSCCARRSGRL